MDEATFKATVKTLKFHKDVKKLELAGDKLTAHWTNDKGDADKDFSVTLSAATKALDASGSAFAEAAAKEFVTAWDAMKAERKKDKKDKKDKD